MGLFDQMFGAGPVSQGLGDVARSDGLADIMQAAGLSMLSGTRQNPLGGMAELLPGIQRNTMVRQERAEAKAKENKTLEWLKANHPDVASMVQGGMDVGDAFTYALRKQELEKGPDPTSDMRNWQYAQANPAFADYLNRSSGGATGRLSTQPVWGTDADGNPVLGQLSNDGRFVPSQLPEGVRPISPSDLNEGKAYGTGVGKARAEANAALPAAEGLASIVLGSINSLKNDPYLPSMVGPTNSRWPNVTGDAHRVQSKMDQIQGQAFLQARELLKGGGSITDFESKRAEAAFVRLNAAQTVEDYTAALDEFGNAVSTGLAKLEQSAGRSPNPGSGGDLYERYGLER